MNVCVNDTGVSNHNVPNNILPHHAYDIILFHGISFNTIPQY